MFSLICCCVYLSRIYPYDHILFFRKFDAKPDSELFVVDTAGKNEAGDTEVKPLSAKLKKRSNLAETPKCFEILLPSSKVNKTCTPCLFLD